MSDEQEMRFDDVPYGPIDDQPRVKISLDPDALRAVEIALEIVAGHLDPEVPHASPHALSYELQSVSMRAAVGRAVGALRVATQRRRESSDE